MEQEKIDIKAKKKEAIERMRMLGIFGPTIKQFKDEDLVSISEPPFGAFYWAEGEDLERIKEFEREHNALAYVVVRSYTSIGKMDSYLFVSDDKDDWATDKEGCADGEVFAYVYNHDDPELSEFGYITVKKTVAAGLRRLW